MKHLQNSIKLLILSIIFLSTTLNAIGLKKKLFLTYEESIWIQQVKVVKISIPSHKEPFSFFENGKYKGYNVDILNKISELTKLKFQVQGYKEEYYQTAYGTTGAIIVQNQEINALITEPFHKDGFRFAIDPNNEFLYNILQKSIKKITPSEYKEINEKWFGAKGTKGEKEKSGIVRTKLNLSEKEQEWLNKNPILKVAVMSYWPVDEDGSNIHYRLLDLISKYSNLNIVPIGFKNWDSGYNQAVDGTNISSILGLSWSMGREKHFFYTPAYDFTPCYIITKEKNENIKSFKDLKDKTVYLKKSSITNELIKKEPDAKVINIDTDEQMLNDLSTKDEADALLSYFADLKKLKELNLKVVDTIYEKHGEVSIGINKKYPELYSIISKAFNKIPKNEITALRNKGKIAFTKKEKEWLNKNEVVKYTYDPNLKPIEWTNELGEHTGIISDLLKVVQTKSNINLQALHSQSKKDGLNNIRSKKAKIFSAINITAERKKQLNFTKNSIFSTPYVFISKKEFSFPNGFSDAKDKKIAVLKDKDTKETILQANPDQKLIEVAGVEEAFDKLEKDEFQVLIMNAVSAQYYLKC